MTRFELTQVAHRDLFDIWIYIARDSIRAADDVERVIRENCALIAEAPYAGKSLPFRLRRNVRCWVVNPHNNYLILYEPSTKPIRIVAVLHGARDLPKLIR